MSISYHNDQKQKIYPILGWKQRTLSKTNNTKGQDLSIQSSFGICKLFRNMLLLNSDLCVC